MRRRTVGRLSTWSDISMPGGLARAANGIKWVGVSGDLVERSGFVRHWPLPEWPFPWAEYCGLEEYMQLRYRGAVSGHGRMHNALL